MTQLLSSIGKTWLPEGGGDDDDHRKPTGSQKPIDATGKIFARSVCIILVIMLALGFLSHDMHENRRRFQVIMRYTYAADYADAFWNHFVVGTRNRDGVFAEAMRNSTNSRIVRRLFSGWNGWPNETYAGFKEVRFVFRRVFPSLQGDVFPIEWDIGRLPERVVMYVDAYLRNFDLRGSRDIPSLMQAVAGSVVTGRPIRLTQRAAAGAAGDDDDADADGPGDDGSKDDDGDDGLGDDDDDDGSKDRSGGADASEDVVIDLTSSPPAVPQRVTPGKTLASKTLRSAAVSPAKVSASVSRRSEANDSSPSVNGTSEAYDVQDHADQSAVDLQPTGLRFSPLSLNRLSNMEARISEMRDKVKMANAALQQAEDAAKQAQLDKQQAEDVAKQAQLDKQQAEDVAKQAQLNKQQAEAAVELAQNGAKQAVLVSRQSMQDELRRARQDADNLRQQLQAANEIAARRNIARAWAESFGGDEAVEADDERISHEEAAAVNRALRRSNAYDLKQARLKEVNDHDADDEGEDDGDSSTRDSNGSSQGRDSAGGDAVVDDDEETQSLVFWSPESHLHAPAAGSRYSAGAMAHDLPAAVEPAVVASPAPDITAVVGTPPPDLAAVVASPAPDITAVMGTPAPEPAEVSAPDPSPAAEARRRIGIREAGRLRSHNAKPKPRVSEMKQTLDVLWMSARSCDAAIPNKQLAAFIKFVASFLDRRFTAALNDVATRRQAIADAYEALIDTWLADDTLRQDWERPSDEGSDDEGPAKKRCRKGCGKRP